MSPLTTTLNLKPGDEFGIRPGRKLIRRMRQAEALEPNVWAVGTVAEPAGISLGGQGGRSRMAAVARLLLVLALLLLVFWPQPAWGLASEGGRLFDLHCAGCHPQGGNIIRRGRTLKEPVLRREGIDGPAAVAMIAASGIGRMDGYGAVLGEGGAERVGDWVWQQALAGWPRTEVPQSVELADSASLIP
jgi:cytochrome c6